MIESIESAVWLAALTVAVANETVLPFNQWIISPCINPHASGPVTRLPSATTTSVLYAISEPLYTAALVWLAAPPWWLVLALQLVHCHVGAWGTLIMKEMLRAGTSPDYSAEDKYDAPLDRDRASRWPCVLLYHLAVQTSAASNAAVLLWLQSFGASSRPQQSTHLAISDLCALGAVIIARYADYSIANVCHRAQYLGQRRGRHLVRHSLCCLAMLLLGRAAMRWVLGMSVVLGRYPGDSELLFGSHRWQWIRDSTGNDLQ